MPAPDRTAEDVAADVTSAEHVLERAVQDQQECRGQASVETGKPHVGRSPLPAPALLDVEVTHAGAFSSECAHAEADVEWWFVQGLFEPTTGGTTHFMASVFRHRPPGTHPHGTSLLLALLAPGATCHASESRVDGITVEQAARFDNDVPGKLDERVVRAFRRELQAYGVPAPIIEDRAPVVFGGSPLKVEWGDFELRQDARAMDLAFTVAGSRCELELLPSACRMHARGIGAPVTRSLDYVTYPTLTLCGHHDGAPVTGEAWFDHQWGPADAWVVSRDSRQRVMGWEWFGIRLDAGTELLLIEHRDMRTRRSVAKCALLCHGGEAIVLRDYCAKPVRYWQSPRTRVRYPVAWRIGVPECHAELVFEPLALAQEIAVFGASRAVWEGAGRITGTWQGRPAAGSARLELHGYGFLFDGRKYFKAISRDIDRAIGEVLPKHLADDELARLAGRPEWRHDASAYNEIIAKPVWDLISRGGKQWRAIFNVLFLEALGVDSAPYLKLTSTVPELCHAGSLIIDDIQDGSRIRRGDACIHLRYGVPVAINAANMLYFLPFLGVEELTAVSDAQLAANYRIVFRCFVRAHLGQALDIQWSLALSRKSIAKWAEPGYADVILQMYADKTAAFIEGGAEIACVLAHASDAMRAAAVRFARTLGVSFQMIDDVLNFAVSRRWGKTTGEDLREGKTTYVIHRAWCALPRAERAALGRILCSPRLRASAAGLDAGIALVRQSGVLEACRQEAAARVDEAWEAFSVHLRPSEQKLMLRLLCDNLMEIVFQA